MSVAESAKAFYDSDLRAKMEVEHFGEFVAIEPKSMQFFVSPTFMGAAMAAKEAIPNDMSFVVRVGHDAAVHIGSASL